METALTWDSDGDGLIENSGKPDQTFDSWVSNDELFYPLKLMIIYEQHHHVKKIKKGKRNSGEL